ncbi:ATP synthase F0 subunit B [Carboxydothermus islandicus]|nr:ATP synthase F0 subunit B [Carboxydothermus islandicus]
MPFEWMDFFWTVINFFILIGMLYLAVRFIKKYW